MPRDTFSSRANASTLVQPFSRSTAWSLNSCVYRCHFLIRSSPFSAKVFKARVSHFRGALQAELSDLPGGWLKVTETHTVTGGMGRFTGAQGSFTVELFHKLEP